MSYAPKKPLLIFDLDGTLYRLSGGSYTRSRLRTQVNMRAKLFVAKQLKISKSNSKKILQELRRRYHEETSLGLEQEYGIDRYSYFNFVWNISPVGIVQRFSWLRSILLDLRQDYRLALLSDAPRIWIQRVLRHLRIDDIFVSAIHSGEGNIRKSTGNPFRRLIRLYGASAGQTISVGDQEKTDVIPAKKAGTITVFVHPKYISSEATVSLHSLRQLPDFVHQIKKLRRQR